MVHSNEYKTTWKEVAALPDADYSIQFQFWYEINAKYSNAVGVRGVFHKDYTAHLGVYH